MSRHVRERLRLTIAAALSATAICAVASLVVASQGASADTSYCNRNVPAYTDCANIGGGSSTYANGLWDENANLGDEGESSYEVCETAWYGTNTLASDRCAPGAIGSGTDLCEWYVLDLHTSAHAVNDSGATEYDEGYAENTTYSDWCG